MKISLALTSGCLVLLIAAVSAQYTNSAESPSEQMNPDEALLYIVPKSQLEILGWGPSNMPSATGFLSDATTNIVSTTIYRIADFKELKGDKPFESIFGSDWVIVPLDTNETLFRLLSAHTPDESPDLAAVRIDTRGYQVQEITFEPVWNNGLSPKSIMLKWAEWWQGETNAMPVVLILVSF